jgi:hypothetical protein
MKGKFRFLKEQVVNTFKLAIEQANNAGAEICGLLVDNGYFIELVQTKNKSRGGTQFRR